MGGISYSPCRTDLLRFDRIRLSYNVCILQTGGNAFPFSTSGNKTGEFIFTPHNVKKHENDSDEVLAQWTHNLSV
jgi:hypothetical protein